MSAEVAVARWTAEGIARVVGARMEGEGGAPVVAVTTDSREARAGAVFFALDGARVRGVDYVPDAFGSGCSVVVVPADWVGDVPAGRAALRVSSPLAALEALAADARRAWTGPVLAITGSVGKTTAKEMTAAVLEAGGPVLRSPSSFNTVEGVARTILAQPDPPRLAVLEVGASTRGEIARLARTVRPTAAAVTNVGAAHLEGFGTLDDVAREKTDLLRSVRRDRRRHVDGDDARLVAACADLAGPLLRTGLGPDVDLRAVDVRLAPDGGTRFRVDGVDMALGVPGVHQVRNALIALAFGRAHGVPLDEGARRLARFAGVSGRLAVRRAAGLTVCDDSYNANPTSVAAALDWFAELPVEGRKAVALGDMRELGPGSARWHTDAGARVAAIGPAFCVFVGEESRAAFEEARRRLGDRSVVRHATDSDEAARALRAWVEPGDAVLVKGSRAMAMERIVRALLGDPDRPADAADVADAADPGGPAGAGEA